MHIYISQGSQQFGPFYIEQMIQLFEEGRIQPDDLIWYPDLLDWISVSSFFKAKLPSPEPPVQSLMDIGVTVEKLVAKREQLKSIVSRLQYLLQDRDEQKWQNRFDDIGSSQNESLWFRQSRANVSTELKYQNLETLRQIADYEHQIAQLDVKIERMMKRV